MRILQYNKSLRRLTLLKSVEDISTTKKRLKIEIPSDVIEKEISESLEKIRQQAKIPGYRQGKAPVSLIEKRFGKDVEAEVLDKIIPAQLGDAIREADIKIATMPQLEEEFDFKRKNPLNLSITVEILPKIENLAYENIAVADIPIAVEEADVDEFLKKLQDQKAVYEVADKEVETDDLVTFEYEDSEITGAKQDTSSKEAIKQMGNEIFPPDILEKAIGKKKGDIVEFDTIIDEQKSKELAGKTAHVKVKVSEVKQKKLPAIDDELAKDLGVDTLPLLREKLREKLIGAKKSQAKRMHQAEIITKLIESNPVDVPESLLSRELESLIMNKSIAEDKELETEPDNVSAESAIDPSVNEPTSGSEPREKTEDKNDALKQRALRNVRASVIIDMIGQKEGVTVTEDELNQRIAFMAQRLSSTPEAVRSFYSYKDGALDSLRHSIYEEKVLDLLVSKAVVETKENK
jgi:trigger factor